MAAMLMTDKSNSSQLSPSLTAQFRCFLSVAFVGKRRWHRTVVVLLTTPSRSQEGSSTVQVVRVGHPSQSRGRLAHPSQVFQTCFHGSDCHSASRLPLFAATPCTASRADSDVPSTRTVQWEAIGVLPVPSHRSYCHNLRICFFQSIPCQCAFARCERVWRTSSYRHRIASVTFSGNSQVVHGEAARYVNC